MQVLQRSYPSFCLIAAFGLAVGCAHRVRHEPIPYQFREPLLEESRTPLSASPTPSKRKTTKQDKARSALVARCQALAGQPFSGAQRHAEAALVQACLTQSIPHTVIAQGPLSDAPEVGDLIVFVSPPDHRIDDAASVGVVVARHGSRVSFVYILGSRARLGVLNLSQPNRRRLPYRRKVENSYVRIKRKDDAPTTRYLAGQRLAGFLAATIH